ncbi:acetate--CoA ligase family protein [Hydrogenophaga sp. BPS33]|uniref:acetate--CoA ligase family protein n=1 Tax=Hydrogenophaga sp. BPS33 TaxID=2651974 RepID=UPI00131F56A7|nr:acetate--CoA ligase [Hydrogenophaga sp. BPS33]QHE85508.1 CoA-binding protein [Hydrogenophaga sp. BPS33]
MFVSLDPRAALRRALNPASIAVIGASDNPNKIGGRPIAYLSRYGYQGKVFPINPMRSDVQGMRAFPSLASLDTAPDLAIVAVPGDAAVDAVQQCADAGVSLCIIMSSGFGEVHEAGKRQEAAMRAMAKAAGMRLVGPNSQGLANFGTGAVASFSTMFTEVAPADGPIGIISQSGAMSVVPYGLLRARGLGVRHSHATGNDCDVTVCELATVVAEDPELKLLMLYLEQIPDPWHLAEAARVARERDLPIVVLKSGRTPAGQAAAQSHTGALASEDRSVDAFLQEHGIFRAQSVADLVASAPLYLQGWRPRGRRLVAISNSGAVCVLTADAATRAHMPLEPLSAHTQKELRSILPGFASVGNPVDITAALLTNSQLFGDILPVIARDPAADAFLVGVPVAGTGYDVDAFARDSAAFASDTKKPLVVAAPQELVAGPFRQQGLVTFTTEGEAIDALSNYLSHMELMAAARSHAPTFVRPSESAGPLVLLDEAQSLRSLGDAGVPVVAHRLCHSEAEAAAAFADLGAVRVVVKGCTAEASHKSELGLVELGLQSAQAVREAYARMVAAAGAAGIGLSGVLVAEQMKGQREMMIGARIDPVFGPQLLVGDGGKYVEAMPDISLLPATATLAQVERAVRSLRMAPLVDGVRGEPPIDLQAFCEAAVAVGRLIANPHSGIRQLDINPVIVCAQGAGCVAVDAVVYRADAVPIPTHDQKETTCCPTTTTN